MNFKVERKTLKKKLLFVHPSFTHTLSHKKSDFHSCVTSLPCSSRLVLFICPLSSPSVLPDLACMQPPPPHPPALTSPGFCWETKNVQASVFRRNKEIGWQDRQEEGRTRYMKLSSTNLISESHMKMKRRAATSNCHGHT